MRGRAAASRASITGYNADCIGITYIRSRLCLDRLCSVFEQALSDRLQARSAQTMSAVGCSHLDTIHFKRLPDDIAGCEECLKTGGWWVHLRMCMECGKIGCCD